MKPFIFSLSVLSLALADCSNFPLNTVTFDFFSDSTDWVVGNLYPDGNCAVIVNPQAGPETSIGPASYRIWESAHPYDPLYPSNCTFTKSFYIPGIIQSASLIYRTDDFGSIKINGVDPACNTHSSTQILTCNLTSYMTPGLNQITFYVQNYANPDVSNYTNRGWVAYYLSIRSLVNSL